MSPIIDAEMNCRKVAGEMGRIMTNNGFLDIGEDIGYVIGTFFKTDVQVMGAPETSIKFTLQYDFTDDPINDSFFVPAEPYVTILPDKSDDARYVPFGVYSDTSRKVEITVREINDYLSRIATRKGSLWHVDSNKI